VCSLALKKELAGLTLTQEASQKEWEVVQKMVLAMAFGRTSLSVRPLQKMCTHRVLRWKKLKINFYIEIFLESFKHIPNL
jgi:hypothetical protein